MIRRLTKLPDDPETCSLEELFGGVSGNLDVRPFTRFNGETCTKEEFQASDESVRNIRIRARQRRGEL